MHPIPLPPGPAAAGELPENAPAEPLDGCAIAARGAFSSNTRRAIQADLAVYAAWCRERGLRALPAPAATVAAFVDAMADVRASATVRRHVASITTVHRRIGRSVDGAPVKLALRRMHRLRGRRQAQAQGLTWPLRERLLAAAGDRLIDARNRALVAVAYDALLRRSGLTSLQVSDLVEEIRGGATLLVRRGKTDPEGRGAMLYLARDTVALAREWRARSGVSEGSLFRSLSKGGVVGPRGRTPARCRGSTRRWRAARVCRRRSRTACPATARGWARRRTWLRPASSCRRSCRPGGARPPRW